MGYFRHCKDFASKLVSHAESGAATLVALGSRNLGRAESFIEEMQGVTAWDVRPIALGSYEELLRLPDIDAVYLPIPTAVRKEWVIRAAAAGKHVLCEKPCAVNADDLREMIAACEEHGVLFMDGVVFMHDPRFARLREMIDGGKTLGQIKRVTSSFTFHADEQFVHTDIRGISSLEPTGCLGDLGWYCLRASLWAMNWEMPVSVSGKIVDSFSNDAGASVIMGFSAEMNFASGVTASIYCSFLLADQRWLSISGTDGSLRIPDFVNPVEANDTAWEVNYQREIKSANPGMSNPARLFITFAAALNADVPEGRWAEFSLKTQILQDACELSAKLGRPVAL